MTSYLALVVLLIVSVEGGNIIERGKDLISRWYIALVKHLPGSIQTKATYLFNVERNVRFLLFTRGNPSEPFVINCGSVESMRDSFFDLRKKTKIIVPGWRSAGDTSFSDQLKDAYLDSFDYNIISVDWSRISYNFFYPYARVAVNYIGPYVANLIHFLVEEVRVSPDDIHMLGHSLGAHIAGLAGENSFYNVSRITGMDPASPLFSSNENSHTSLDRTDAKFVDVIHTSVYFIGVGRPIGHADFYPNGGGPLQPGCGVEIGICTHRRSYRYYIESLSNPWGFPARKCDSWSHYQAGDCGPEIAYMGEITSPDTRGKYFLRTATAPPFALGGQILC